MRQANQAIMRRRYPIPTVDEVLHTMNGSKVFSKLDLKWGDHQLELSPESREITTFATPDGMFQYKRLLFGVCSASEQYQHEIVSALAGIECSSNSRYWVARPIRIEYFKHVTELIHSRPISVQDFMGLVPHVKPSRKVSQHSPVM